MGVIRSKQWINSIHLEKSPQNSIIINEKIVDIDEDTSQVVYSENKLRTINDPKQTIYITKPLYRTHKFKKETEKIDHCDSFEVENRLLLFQIGKLLYNGKTPRTLRDACASPYLYNADINIEVLIRAAYQQKQKHSVIPLKIGSLDIETSVLGDDSINCISFCCEKNVYTACLDSFLYKYNDKDKKIKATEKDIVNQMHQDIQPYLDKYGFNVTVKVCNSEVELIKWIFKQIHLEKPDFILIWNIGFDIPYILNRLKHYDIDPVDIFCHPDVPKDLRYVHFKEDKRPVAHIVEKWHWLYCTDYSQFIDGMLLYARIRKTKTKEPSYTLDYISTKEIKAGKLKFSEGSHYEMQTRKFVEYVVYNMVDAMLLMMMEWKNHDITQMLHLTGCSMYTDFSKQTVMLKNIYYKFCLDRGEVFATTGPPENMVCPYDNQFLKQGGAVLRAHLVKDIGLDNIIERPDYESMLVPVAADLDFKAYYPSTESMYGLSKENKICTVVNIDGHDKGDVEKLMGGIASPQANSVWIAHDFFGLPNYEEWSELAIKKFFVP